jgi:hypothetical protein
MKMSPELKKAQENMVPGEITADGFMGDDRRPLVDIIEADEERFQSLGLGFDETSEKLARLLTEGRKGLGEPTTVDEDWLVKVDEARGFLPCPFEDGIFRKITATVTHKKSQLTISYSELSIHLLEAHHFLQGKGSPFRLESDKLKQVLDL